MRGCGGGRLPLLKFMAKGQNKDHKKRLKQFTDEMMLLGSLQGFRYFQPWLRGKEELLLTVVNEDAVWQSHYPLPAPNVLSVQCQDQNLRLSPSREEMAGNMEDMVPPASPYEREISMPGTNCTLFLLAVYAKYQHPYVWIRSSHERFVNVNKNDALAHDSPLKLKSISEWNVKSQPSSPHTSKTATHCDVVVLQLYADPEAKKESSVTTSDCRLELYIQLTNSQQISEFIH
ncbi:uncharacterized protein LOC122806697 isoform X5 [Protopterus annectens]|uniref:uncharacterized protein LOC122806697 isoform X5 n=1 Tax=Protopterus annectens TaxID=7888 RepID=UPI001CFC03AC|nr:uncharacterized protein LOC122806697 isoform X5 [Protopterus annectens]